ncbi:50S ribosomal protein L35ae [Candidatus Woesearchaeota archaeon]|nr:50S ribosomal protein L35ae [Candidatus Woesearchaeota archaeon]
MKGVIVNFRGGKHTQTNNQMVVLPEGVTSKDKAVSLIGKSAVWTSAGKNKKDIKGKITNVHGRNGAVRVVFEKGMPGQSVGQRVEIK